MPLSSALQSALQLRSSLPPCSHRVEVPAVHPHVIPLTIPSPPAQVQTFPLSLSSTVMRGQDVPGPTGQGAFLLSCTVYYSKRGIWLEEETGGQLACREARLAGRCSPAPTLSPTSLWGGCTLPGAQVPGAMLGLLRVLWGGWLHAGAPPRGGRLPASPHDMSLLASALPTSKAGSWAPQDRECLGGF